MNMSFDLYLITFNSKAVVQTFIKARLSCGIYDPIYCYTLSRALTYHDCKAQMRNAKLGLYLPIKVSPTLLFPFPSQRQLRQK
jgi:hypothetical protein